MKVKKNPGQKIICLNRKASFNYTFHDLLEAGIALKGSEVKSLREGKASIADSYAAEIRGEIFLINSHIPLYKQSSYNNHDPKDNRKLLLKKKEINDLLTPLHKALFIESNPSPVKYAASLLKLCKQDVRLPLVKIMDTTKIEVESALKYAKLI